MRLDAGMMGATIRIGNKKGSRKAAFVFWAVDFS